MARRRRSLIGGRRPTSAKDTSSPPSKEVAAPLNGPPSLSDAPAPKPFGARRRQAESAGKTLIPEADELLELEEDGSFGAPEAWRQPDVTAPEAPPPVAPPPLAPPPEVPPQPAVQAPPSASEPLATSQDGATDDEATEFTEAATDIAEIWSADIGVEENTYVETGKFAEDTTDHGWQETAYGSPATINSEMADEEVIADFNAATDGDPLGAGFIDLGDGVAPPTEEAPSSMMEDLSQPYSSPMSVPEPPPVPGIIDRYTPPPVPRRSPQGPGAEGSRPAFTPAAAPGRAPGTPAGLASRRTPMALPSQPPDLRSRTYDEDAIAPPAGVNPRTLIVAGAVGALLVIIIGFLIATMLGVGASHLPGTHDAPAPAPVAPVLPVRHGVGAQAPTPTPVAPTDAVPTGVAPADAAPADVVPADAAPADVVPADPAPAARPAPAPAPRPAPASAPRDITNGTLSVESNERVLVSINGSRVDYTPLELAVPAGTYTIGAALQGQADSEQVQEVSLEAGERQALYFTF